MSKALRTSFSLISREELNFTFLLSPMMPLFWLAFGEMSLLSSLAALLLTPPVAVVLLLTPVYLLLRELPLLSPLLREILTAPHSVALGGKGLDKLDIAL